MDTVLNVILRRESYLVGLTIAKLLPRVQGLAGNYGTSTLSECDVVTSRILFFFSHLGIC